MIDCKIQLKQYKSIIEKLASLDKHLDKLQFDDKYTAKLEECKIESNEVLMDIYEMLDPRDMYIFHLGKASHSIDMVDTFIGMALESYEETGECDTSIKENCGTLKHSIVDVEESMKIFKKNYKKISKKYSDTESSSGSSSESESGSGSSGSSSEGDSESGSSGSSSGSSSESESGSGSSGSSSESESSESSGEKRRRKRRESKKKDSKSSKKSSSKKSSKRK